MGGGVDGTLLAPFSHTTCRHHIHGHTDKKQANEHLRSKNSATAVSEQRTFT